MYLARIVERVLDVLGLEVEVAAVMDADRGPRTPLGDPFVHQLGIEFKLASDVGRGDDVRGAGGIRELQHREAFLQRLGAIVRTVEDVAVDVGEAHTRGSKGTTVA